MSITAFTGPVVGFGAAPYGDNNGQEGPSVFVQGYGLLDPRAQFTYAPGQSDSHPFYSWYSTGFIPVIDQVPSAIAANNIATSQAPTADTALTLVSSSGAGITVGQSITNASTGATVTGLLAIDTKMTPVAFGSVGTLNAWDPTKAIARNVRITTNADDTGGTYDVAGYDLYGFPMTENITGVSSGVASGKKAFKYIASVTPAGTINSTAVTVGTGDVIGFPMRVDRGSAQVIAIWNGQEAVGSGVGTRQVLQLPAQLADFANSQTWKLAVPFDFTLVGYSWRQGKATSTGSKGASFQSQINGGATTGGALTLASNTDTGTTGAAKAASSITAANTGTAGQTIEFAVSSVTAFTEGDGWIEAVVSNADASGGTITVAVTTPASSTTGDVRGTITLPSASDGTKRLQIFYTPLVANVQTSTGLFGVAQA